MKKILVLFLVINIVALNAQVKWLSFSEAMVQQKIKPKKIIIDFYADWCEPCKVMDKTTYGNPIIANYINDNFYAVKFEADGDEKVNYLGKTFEKTNSDVKNGREALNDFTLFMNVSSIPSTIFLDESSNPITNLNGYLTAKELEVYLMMFSTDDYKKIKNRSDWETYTNKLHSQIKN